MEIWQNGAGTAVSPNPLGRIMNVDKIGILAPNSALFSERWAYWLGTSLDGGRGVVYRHSGGGPPERISDHADERQIATLSTPEDANATSYQSLGHVFYLLTFRSGNRTFCFDSVTGLWHDRAIRNPNTGGLFAYPYISIIILDGVLLGMDYRNGDVWELSDQLFTDDENPIERARILTPIPKEADRLTFYQSVELMADVGNTPLVQTVPNVMMRYSTDRGKTWSQEDWRPIGTEAGYNTRVQWVGLGSGYGIAFEFRIVAEHYISWRMVRLRAQ
jgi:hypothetical protein